MIFGTIYHLTNVENFILEGDKFTKQKSKKTPQKSFVRVKLAVLRIINLDNNVNKRFSILMKKIWNSKYYLSQNGIMNSLTYVNLLMKIIIFPSM